MIQRLKLSVQTTPLGTNDKPLIPNPSNGSCDQNRMFEKINALSRRHLLQAANSTMWFTETGTTLTGNRALFHTAGRDSQRRQRSHSDADFPPLFAWPFGTFGRHRLAQTADIPERTHSAHRSLRHTHFGKTPMTYTGNPSTEPAAQQKLELTDSLSIAPLFFFDARYQELFWCRR